MQIYCPKCKTGYEIEAELIPEQGRRLRCVQCKEVFVCRPEDLKEDSALRQPEHSAEASVTEENATEQAKSLPEENQPEINSSKVEKAPVQEEDKTPEENPAEEKAEEETNEDAQDKEDIDEAEKGIKDIFQRLSVETEALFKEEAAEKPSHKFFGKAKKALGLHRPQNRKYYWLVLLLFGILFLYYARYGIVRNLPFVLPVYEKLGINARILGEGLEFQNVNRREFEEEFINKMEIKGFIASNSEKTIHIPRIRIELLDKNAQSLEVQVRLPNIDVIPGGGKVPFSFVLTKPSLFTKYIYLTFTDAEETK